MANIDYKSNVLDNFKIDDYIFCSNFDSGNLGRVELVEKLTGDDAFEHGYYVEFNTWTTPDCFGTPKESTNRTWFFFSIRGGKPNRNAKINVKNLNRQFKLFSQGMQPVMRIGSAGKWERMTGKPEFYNDEEDFVISFLHRAEKPHVEQYYAFTYPYTYSCCQKLLSKYEIKYAKTSDDLKNIIDKLHRAEDYQKDRFSRKAKLQGTATKHSIRLERKLNSSFINAKNSKKELENMIYYNRELLINSLEGRRVDLLTISSFSGITKKREYCLENLFPEGPLKRPYLFKDKPIIFISARVHPGETPASYVLNGFMNLLLDAKNNVAHILRSMYVFKIVPILNPDGVYRGFYRTDTLGQNLNRMYICPQLYVHPSIYAVKKFIRYLRYGVDQDDSEMSVPSSNTVEVSESESGGSTSTDETSSYTKDQTKLMTIAQPPNIIISPMWPSNDLRPFVPAVPSESVASKSIAQCNKVILLSKETNPSGESSMQGQSNSEVSDCGVQVGVCPELSNSSNQTVLKEVLTMKDNQNLFLYIDLHGHASKKGIFMYGNHFTNVSDAVECKLLPKLMAINNPHFHYDSCNFTEKNMYKTEKRDGLSKEGSGRVTVYKMTGLVQSYTLECNYNTGKYVNIIPSPTSNVVKKNTTPSIPPKYTPQIFEEVGRSLGFSILDITNSNPCSRLQHSEARSLQGLRSALRNEVERLNAIRRSNDNRKGPQRSMQQATRRNKRLKGTATLSTSISQKSTRDKSTKFTITKLNSTNSDKNSQHLSPPTPANSTKTQIKCDSKSKSITPIIVAKRNALSITISKSISNKYHSTKTTSKNDNIKLTVHKELSCSTKTTSEDTSSNSLNASPNHNTITSIDSPDSKEISPKNIMSLINNN